MSNQAEFTQIIKENQGIIFKVSTVYTTNEEDRKDLHQEIIIQLWKAFGRFRNDSKITTWIYKIALNTSITQFRKTRRHVSQVPIDKAVMNYTESSDTDFEEQLKFLYQQIEQLNDLDKGIIFLLLEDKSYSEIAAIAGLSLTNVATRISRIKQKIKVQINFN